ncbi:MAG: uncharacterized protein JWM68_3780 [Verrucomicrobiales bacterium]|nr:uncharacterized protein [Verrucomicrobiales bacterium]
MTSANDRDRQRLKLLRDNLAALHKTLIESERIIYEQTFGKLESPNRFLQLLISDPWFAWLHPISELVVLIDETLDSKEPLMAGETRELMKRTSMLLKASEEGDGFERSYFDALQRTPDVILAHADVMRCLSEPKPKSE